LQKNQNVRYTGDWWKCAEVGCLTARPYGSEGNSVQFPPDIT
jgi:hypothetical protein